MCEAPLFHLLMSPNTVYVSECVGHRYSCCDVFRCGSPAQPSESTGPNPVKVKKKEDRTNQTIIHHLLIIHIPLVNCEQTIL